MSLTHHSKENISKEISKLTPISYNRFYWWRKYATGETPISKRSSIEDKIKAGYYNFPTSYFWQSQQALAELDNFHPEDIEKRGIVKTRYKRLTEDYHKDENIKLQRIIEDFTDGYILKKEQVLEVMETFDGTIEELHQHFETKYRYAYLKTYKKSF
jgi:hypothetical protein